MLAAEKMIIMHEGSNITSPKEKAKTKRWLNRNVAAMGFTSLFSDASHEMVTAVLPFFLAVIGAGPEALGLIEGFSDGASSLVKSFSGYLSDKIGKRKPIMSIGYALTGIFTPVIAAATSWLQVLGLRATAWMGRGARGPPRDALLADSVPPEATGKAFGFHRAMDTLGAIIGPALALFFITFLNYHQIIAISVIPGLIAFFIVVFFVREAQKKPLSDTPIVSTHGDVVVNNRGFIKSIRTLPRSFKLFLVGVGVFGLGNFANSLFTLRAQQVLAPRVGVFESSAIAIGLYTLLNVAYAASSFPIGALSDKIGRKRILAAGYFISAITCLGTAFLTADFLVLVPIFILAGFFTAITDTIEGTAAADLLPTESRGTGFGVLQTINGIGDFASSAVVGALWALISPRVAFAYATILSVFGGLILLYLTRGNHPLR
ncbi:MAG TPA: MFS transporter [Acidobacteriota bacterium]|nr:MFS transporter [Acidobacteriota bacterium]